MIIRFFSACFGSFLEPPLRVVILFFHVPHVLDVMVDDLFHDLFRIMTDLAVYFKRIPGQDLITFIPYPFNIKTDWR